MLKFEGVIFPKNSLKRLASSPLYSLDFEYTLRNVSETQKEIERVEDYDGDVKFVGEHNYHNNAPALVS